MEQRNSNKTIMSSVLFLDIVEYSKEAVLEQISLKERFNRFLSEALKRVPEVDRIILDTGDGAAVSFIGDIEEALQTALIIRENLFNQDERDTPKLKVRMGINLGPVRLVRDINGQPNIVGDGINVAQRIMAFAEINQILLSRSYHDAVSRLSSKYLDMFRFKGSQTDKHVREHEIYAICHPGEPVEPEVVAATTEVIAEPVPVKRKTPLYVGIGAMLLAGGAALMLSQQPTTTPAGGGGTASALVAASQVKAASAAGVSSITPADMAPYKKPEAGAKQATVEQKPKNPEPGKLSTNKPVDGKKTQPASRVAAASQVASVGDGHIIVSCAEGSKVFVDGSIKGKVGSVPFSVNVPAGKHLVVVDSPNHLINQTVTIVVGQTIRVGNNSCN